MIVFPEPYNRSKNKINVELNLSNYATKSDQKTQQVIIHPILLKRLIQQNYETTPVDLSKQSNVIKMMLSKRLYMMN